MLHASPTHRSPRDRRPHRSLLRTWFLGNTLLAGLFALGWLVLRSGPRPSRLAYPCQQAAISAATLAFGAPLVGAVLALRRGLRSGFGSPRAVAAAAVGLIVTVAAWGLLTGLRASPAPLNPALAPGDEYRAEVFHVADCPQDPVGDRFLCIEVMLELMGGQGLKFYRSPVTTPVAGPQGIVAADDVVILKINYQWPQRGGTNTDVLRGLVRAIVDHPDGFSGEVVVAENSQFRSVEGFDRSENNAQDIGLSPHDVVVHFSGLGHDISHFDWTAIRDVEVAEYSAGDYTDGYVVYPQDPGLNGKVSYPKFQTDLGTWVSIRDGIWEAGGAGYDRERLKLINLPVLKSHGAVYGATACVKNYMGLVTGLLGTNSHSAIRWGLLGDLLGEIRPADLNILDAVWVNADPNSGPSTTYAGATRRDELVAGTDPVALDIWAVKNILISAFLDNGFTPPWPTPSADPDDPESEFREYLDNSLYWLLDAGFDATNDFDRIDAYGLTVPFFADDFETGDVSVWSVSLP